MKTILWHNWLWSAVSGNTVVRGVYQTLFPHRTGVLEERLLEAASFYAAASGRPWDPHNVTLAYTENP